LHQKSSAIIVIVTVPETVDFIAPLNDQPLARGKLGTPALFIS